MNETKVAAWDSELFLLSAADRDELLHRIRELLEILPDHAEAPLVDLSAAVNHAFDCGVDHLRLGIVAVSIEQLIRHLRRASEKIANPKCVQIREVTGLYFVAEPLYRTGGLAFLYPGEGAQFPGMLAGLPSAFPVVQDIFARCESLATVEGGPGIGLLDRLVTPPSADQIGNAWKTAAGDFSTDIFSVAIGNWVYREIAALFEITPDMVAGHSAGEMSALCSVGVIDSDEEVISIARATHSIDRDVARYQDPAALLALGASREKAESIVSAARLSTTAVGDSTAYVAMDNCPHQTVIVGLPPAIGVIEADLRDKNLIYERLELDRPYHTRLFEPFMAPLRDMFRSISFHLPRCKIYSCSTGLPFPHDAEATRQLAVDHWVSTVEFTKLIRQMHDDGARVFLEVGPRGNLSAFVEDILRGRLAAVIPFNVPRISPLSQIQHALARMVVQGVPVNVGKLYADRDVRPIVLQRETKTNGHQAVRATSKSGVLHGFQSVMHQFLQVQHDVMGDFLAQRHGLAQRHQRESRRIRRRRTPVRRHIGTPPPAQVSNGSSAARLKQSVPTDFPLIGEIIEHIAGERIVMRRRLELPAEPYADHHTVGGQQISRVDPTQHGLPVMPMTFTLETMAEAASKLVPNLSVIGLRDIQLKRWLAFYADDPVSIELTAAVVAPNEVPKPIRATLEPNQIVVQVSVRDLGNSGSGPGAESGDAAVGQVILGPSYPTAPTLEPFRMANPRDCRITLDYLYDNLFHGPLFRGVRSLDQYGDRQIVGTVEVLPRLGLFTHNDSPSFLLDPVTLDTTMHPIAGWHLEQPDQSGRIMLPFALDRVDCFAPCPQVGERLTCQGQLRKETPRYVVHDLDVIDAQRNLRWRMSGIRLWRFYLPFDGVNFHGPKDVYFLSKEWSAAAPSDEHSACVRFDAPTDLMQPAILWAASKVMLSPREQRAFATLDGSTPEKAAWMFCRAACKDATRKMFLRESGRSMFVADIEVDDSRPSDWRTVARDPDSTVAFPRVAVGHDAGRFVAIASSAGRPYISVISRTASLAGADLPDLTADELNRCKIPNGENSSAELGVELSQITHAKRLVMQIAGDSSVSLIDAKPNGIVTFRLPNRTELTVKMSRADDLFVATTV